MKNTLSDLNNHLFMALERINDDELTAEQLDKELKRSSSVAKIAESIVHTADIQDIQVKALRLKIRKLRPIWQNRSKPHSIKETAAQISQRENVVLNHHKLRCSDPELTKTGIKIAKLRIALIDKNKRGNRKCI